jgi:steroid delta-isomerase
MSNCVRIVLLALLVALRLQPAAADDDQAAIRAALMQWTADFNARRTDKVCDLFEPGVVADVRDAEEQNHKVICDRLKRVLNDASRRYSYSPEIKEILVLGDLAVVRLAWTLTIAGGGIGEVRSAEQGLDVFRRQADGSWKIMRFMSYDQ